MPASDLTSRWLAPVERLFGALTDPERRERTALNVLAAYVAIWTLYGVLAKSSQDVHVDMAELVAWGRELALGYPKHPPLAAWLVRGWFTLFPVTDWAFYLLAMTVAATGLWIVWRLAADYLEPEKRAVGLVLLMLVPFFNFHALKFNPNTLLIPLWGATTLCFLRSFERRSVGWGALAGLFAAAAMLGKYWSVMLLVGLGVAALTDPRRGRYFRSAAPWVTTAVGAVAIAPHVVWLVGQDFAPFSYAMAVHEGSTAAALRGAAEYLGGSAAYIGLPVLLVLAAARPRGAALADMLWPATRARRLAAWAYYAPLLVPAVAAPLFKVEITSLWSMSAWSLLPVMLLSSPLVTLSRRACVVIVTVAIALPVAMVAAAPFIATSIHRAGVVPAAAHSHLLAERVEHEWRQVTARPLRIVGGNADLAYGVAFYLPDAPSVFPDFDRRAAPWIDIGRIPLEGIAIVCYASDPTCLMSATAQGLVGRRIEVDVTRSYNGVLGKPGRYVIMIVPPRP